MTTSMPAAMRINSAILLLRIASGWAWLYHGSAILFGAFSGPGPNRFAISHHWPVAIAYLVGLAQVTAAAAVLTGVLFRLGAAFVCIVMVGAIVLVHLPHGFDVSNNGIEYPLMLLVVATAFLLTGPGAYSLAARLPSWLQKC